MIRALRVGDDGRMFVKRWGLPAIEAYLVTRYHMYQQVYFHKVNMLTQAYLVNMLERARELAAAGELSLTPELEHMLLNDDLSPQEYVLLNDAHIKVALPDMGATSRRPTALGVRQSPAVPQGVPQVPSNRPPDR